MDGILSTIRNIKEAKEIKVWVMMDDWQGLGFRCLVKEVWEAWWNYFLQFLRGSEPLSWDPFL